jgi:hypothetical protein
VRARRDRTPSHASARSPGLATTDGERAKAQPPASGTQTTRPRGAGDSGPPGVLWHLWRKRRVTAALCAACVARSHTTLPAAMARRGIAGISSRRFRPATTQADPKAIYPPDLVARKFDSKDPCMPSSHRASPTSPSQARRLICRVVREAHSCAGARMERRGAHRRHARARVPST